jgi:hypothetical protein
VSFHELRHTHASALIAQGWDAQAVAARLGDSIATVLSVYVHQFDEAKRSAMRRDSLSSLYDSGSIPEAPGESLRQSAVVGGSGEVVDLQAIRDARQ